MVVNTSSHRQLRHLSIPPLCEVNNYYGQEGDGVPPSRTTPQDRRNDGNGGRGGMRNPRGMSHEDEQYCESDQTACQEPG